MHGPVIASFDAPGQGASSFGGEVDTVLGVSMAPTAVRMVLVEGENADGLTVDEDGFDVNVAADAPTINAADQVVSAILGTQEGAAESGYQVRSTGVTWTDPIEAAALRDALAARKVENVMLVSSFLAAAALAQVVGSSVGYAQTGLLFVEPDTATLAVVNSSDGSITDVHRQPLTPGADSVAELATLLSSADSLDARPDGLFLVGSGVDITPIKPRLEAATGLIVSAPEEPETALARGAALASANAPLFSSSTAALAYAQDPGTGFINPYAVAPGYFDVATDNASGEQALAYSAVPDDDLDAYTALAGEGDFETGTYAGAYTGIAAAPEEGGRRPLFLVASAVAAIFVVGAAALLVALAISMRPTAAVRPEPGHNAVAPKPAPAAPVAPAPASAPAPAPEAPAPAPEAPAPAPRRNRLHRPPLQLPPLPHRYLRRPRQNRPRRRLLRLRSLRLPHRLLRWFRYLFRFLAFRRSLAVLDQGPPNGPGVAAGTPAADTPVAVAATRAPAVDIPVAEAATAAVVAASAAAMVAGVTVASVTDLASPGLGF